MKDILLKDIIRICNGKLICGNEEVWADINDEKVKDEVAQNDKILDSLIFLKSEYIKVSINK